MTAIKLVNSAGKIGIIKDIDPNLLVEDAWSDGANVRMQHGSVFSDPGYAVISFLNSAAVDFGGAVENMLGVTTATGAIAYILAVFNSVWVTMYGAQTDITRLSGAYNSIPYRKWSMTTIGGIPVINNGIDVPQAWLGLTPASPLIDLPNWNPQHRARVIRAFGSYLIGLDFTISGLRKPFDVRWSTTADPGTVPISWDIYDPTNVAGEFPLSSAGGFLIDSVPLGNRNIIYTQTTTWLMEQIGYPLIFSFQQLFNTVGCLSMDCAVAFQGKHFVVTQNDIIIHDGNRWESIVEGKLRKWIFDNIDKESLDNSFCVKNTRTKEIWFFFYVNLSGTVGPQYPNKVFIWNWETSTTTIQNYASGIRFSLPWISSAIDYSFSPITSFTPFSAVVGTFAAQTGNLVVPKEPESQKLIVSSSGFYQYLGYAGDLGLAPSAAANFGYPFSSIERQGIVIGAGDRVVMIKTVFPQLKADGTLTISFGSQYRSLEDPIIWKSRLFDPSKQDHISILWSGRYLAIKITPALYQGFTYAASAHNWQLDSIVIEVSDVGKFTGSPAPSTVVLS